MDSGPGAWTRKRSLGLAEKALDLGPGLGFEDGAVGYGSRGFGLASEALGSRGSLGLADEVLDLGPGPHLETVAWTRGGGL